jgi:diphthamide synthase (EF-2-diphthine--ammonia ligase)
MNVILENVEQSHITILEELAKALKFRIAQVSKEAFPASVLRQRINNIENGVSLITPDWAAIENQAKAIQ